MESVYVLILYFAIGALLGHIAENIFLIFKEKRFRKSGFLYGIFSPLYGFGILAIYFYNLYLSNFPVYVNFIAFFLIPSIIEYMASLFLEKAFHLRLWDYSNYKLNINGRVCLWISSIWFIATFFIVYIGQPFIFKILNNFSPNLIKTLAILFSVYFLIDVIFSVRKKLREKKKKIRIMWKKR